MVKCIFTILLFIKTSLAEKCSVETFICIEVSSPPNFERIKEKEIFLLNYLKTKDKKFGINKATVIYYEQKMYKMEKKWKVQNRTVMKNLSSCLMNLDMNRDANRQRVLMLITDSDSVYENFEWNILRLLKENGYYIQQVRLYIEKC